MFTGLIETMGRLKSVSRSRDGARLLLAPATQLEMDPGDSIAVSGACLTVEKVSGGGFLAFASKETLERTTLGRLRAGQSVNLERALALGDRVGGHLVTGHVDGTGVVTGFVTVGESSILRVRPECNILSLVAEKGSVAIDGVSLTVSRLYPQEFEVVVIPATLARTTLSSLAVGARVNIEADVLARYVARWLDCQGDSPGKGGIHGGRLRELGFW